MGETSKQVESLSQLAAALIWVKDMATKGLSAGPVVLVLTRQSRSSQQNAKFHALIEDIRKQCFRASSPEAVKAVLVSQFAQDRQDAGEPLRHPGETAWDWVNERPVFVRPTTTRFTKRECGGFIESLYAAGVELGVEWSDSAQDVYDEHMERKK